MRLLVALRALYSIHHVVTAQLMFHEEPDDIFFPSVQDANSTGLFPMPQCGHFTLEEATIDQMQAAMGNGSLTSMQLVLCYM